MSECSKKCRVRKLQDIEKKVYEKIEACCQKCQKTFALVDFFMHQKVCQKIPTPDIRAIDSGM